MIPPLVTLPGSPWPVLPTGTYHASLQQVREAYGTNTIRRTLCSGLERGAEALTVAGCKSLFLDGSFLTGKSIPGDYDALWDPSGVDPNKLDPVFLDFTNSRANQKAKFGGEFFPFGSDAAPGIAFISFFQTDSFTGKPKGILIIQLDKETFGKGGS